MITSDYLVAERPHLGGVQRVYRFPNGFGLSMVNSSMLHSYSFAWEGAVLKGVTPDGGFECLTYDTPLTSDVEVFGSEGEADEFIHRAAREIGGVTN